MAPVSRLEGGVVAVLVGVLLLTGPVTGVVDVTERNPTTVGDGNATVTIEHLDTDELVIDEGRFGAAVPYLRLPAVTVQVSDVDGHPRIVYRIQVRSLKIESVTTELLTAGNSGTVKLDPRARALDPDGVSADRYRATIELRVQSFDSDTTIYRTNETVEVRR